MNLNKQYIARKKDIEAYYDILEFIDNIETYKHSKIECLNTTFSLDVSTNMQQCMKASCIILRTFKIEVQQIIRFFIGSNL